jgi:hypothetical protein
LQQHLPAFLVGEFEDDYGIRYTVDDDTWLQHPGSRYHVVEWHVDEQYVVLQNDSANPSDGGLWTRIDWVILGDSGEYRWAFCYAEYRAASEAEAVAAPQSGRDTPRTGCNGFPFSRMKRVGSQAR